jgi:hypothetical protein
MSTQDEYICEKCNYSGKKLSLWKQHCKTKKHIRNTSVDGGGTKSTPKSKPKSNTKTNSKAQKNTKLSTNNKLDLDTEVDELGLNMDTDSDIDSDTESDIVHDSNDSNNSNNSKSSILNLFKDIKSFKDLTSLNKEVISRIVLHELDKFKNNIEQKAVLSTSAYHPVRICAVDDGVEIEPTVTVMDLHGKLGKTRSDITLTQVMNNIFSGTTSAIDVPSEDDPNKMEKFHIDLILFHPLKQVVKEMILSLEEDNYKLQMGLRKV